MSHTCCWTFDTLYITFIPLSFKEEEIKAQRHLRDSSRVEQYDKWHSKNPIASLSGYIHIYTLAIKEYILKRVRVKQMERHLELTDRKT